MAKIDILAPEDGIVTKVNKFKRVKRGQHLFNYVLDSDKENEIEVKATGTGQIYKFNAKEGQRFKKNDILVNMHCIKRRRTTGVYKELMGPEEYKESEKNVKRFKFELKESTE